VTVTRDVTLVTRGEEPQARGEAAVLFGAVDDALLGELVEVAGAGFALEAMAVLWP